MADVCYMSDDLDNDDDFMVDDDDDDDDDDDGVDSGDDDDFDRPVAPKKTSKATGNKNVLKESTNQVSTTSAPTSATTNKAKRTKAVEETYQKLTPHEVSTFLISSRFSACFNHLTNQSHNSPI
jgi:hypothetical protein